MSRSEAYFWFSSNNLITIGFGNLVRRCDPLHSQVCRGVLRATQASAAAICVPVRPK